MKRSKMVFLLLVFCFFMAGCSKNKKTDPPVAENKIRVLGYLYSAGNWGTDINAVDINKLTDINLAFVDPDAAGNFPDNDAFRTVVQKAHTADVRIFFSIGGGNPVAHLAALLANDKRPAFVAGIVAFCEKYGFDGVDVDLENTLINQYYAAFINELSLALKPKNKLVTAALATWNANQISDATLGKFDFINIMAYDKTGPWDLSNPGQHSPYSMAVADFNYFNKTRNIAAGKLFIGLPFYGYGFGNNAPESMSYKDIIAAYPASQHKDMVEVNGGGSIYYNGITTVQQKVSFAIANKAGGVMIWQLLQDSKDANSLLSAIHSTIHQ